MSEVSQEKTGWMCPQCKRIMAPHMPVCPYCGVEDSDVVVRPEPSKRGNFRDDLMQKGQFEIENLDNYDRLYTEFPVVKDVHPPAWHTKADRNAAEVDPANQEGEQ